MKILVDFYLDFVNFFERLILRLLWAYSRLFGDHITIQNAPMQLTFLEYALVWLREQNSLQIGLLSNLKCFSYGCSLFAILVTYSHPTTPTSTKMHEQASFFWLTHMEQSHPR